MSPKDFFTTAAAHALRAVPNSVLKLFGSTRASDGSVMAPDVRASSLVMRLSVRDVADLDPAGAREGIEGLAGPGAGPRIEIGAVRDGTIAGVPVRFYYQEASPTGDEPVVIYLHGGGWVAGSLETHDNTCRFLCVNAGVTVIAVDYPLAPEDKFPAGLNASAAVVDEVLSGSVEGVDASRVAVAGDSAGATFATVICLSRAESGLKQPALQVLICPAANFAKLETDSHKEFAGSTYLNHNQLLWVRGHYTGPDDDLTDWKISPMFAPQELLSLVAPAYIAVAGFDPLRDDGFEYAHLLRAARVPTVLSLHKTLVHPFANAFYVWEDAEAALHQVSGAIRFGLAARPE